MKATDSHNKKKTVTAVIVGHSIFTPIHIQVNQQSEKDSFQSEWMLAMQLTPVSLSDSAEVLISSHPSHTSAALRDSHGEVS